MSKTRKNYYWKDVPEDLRLMCLAEVRGDGHYCTEAVIQLLLDRMNYCDNYSTGATPYQVLKWIDVGFEACLFPLMPHEHDWINYGNQIEKILKKAEDILHKVAPADYRKGHKSTIGHNSRFNVMDFSQRLDVYFSVLYAYTKNWKKFGDRVKMVLADTERNVIHMLSSGEGKSCISDGNWISYFYTGIDTWNPISLLANELFMQGNVGKLFVRIYEDYAIFLYSLREKNPFSELAEPLSINAEDNLRYMCRQLLDTYKLKSDDGRILNTDYLDEKEIFEGIIRDSENRYLAKKNFDDSMPFT